jgi:predicted nucleic acid-binding protein
MATKVADRAVLDTNVLIAATDQGRPEHARALSALNDWPTLGIALYTSGQILREYLAVATRPALQNGLGLTTTDALGNVRTLREVLHFLDESEKVSTRLQTLLAVVDCRGKQMHDANVVATMLTHGVHTVVTINVDDFARYDDHVEVVPL